MPDPARLDLGGEQVLVGGELLVEVAVEGLFAEQIAEGAEQASQHGEP
jgi:hypothetical protein